MSGIHKTLYEVCLRSKQTNTLYPRSKQKTQTKLFSKTHTHTHHTHKVPPQKRTKREKATFPRNFIHKSISLKECSHGGQNPKLNYRQRRSRRVRQLEQKTGNLTTRGTLSQPRRQPLALRAQTPSHLKTSQRRYIQNLNLSNNKLSRALGRRESENTCGRWPTSDAQALGHNAISPNTRFPRARELAKP